MNRKDTEIEAKIQQLREEIHEAPDLTISDMMIKAHRYLTIAATMAGKSGQQRLTCEIFEALFKITDVMEDVEDCEDYVKNFYMWATMAAIEAHFEVEKAKRGNKR